MRAFLILAAVSLASTASATEVVKVDWFGVNWWPDCQMFSLSIRAALEAIAGIFFLQNVTRFALFLSCIDTISSRSTTTARFTAQREYWYAVTDPAATSSEPRCLTDNNNNNNTIAVILLCATNTHHTGAEYDVRCRLHSACECAQF